MGFFKKKKEKINPVANCTRCGYLIYFEEGMETAFKKGFRQNGALPIVVCPHCGEALKVSLQRHADNNVYMYIVCGANDD